ncbi:MAG: hypothetical protein J3Q66DRAFT_375781 [Benniella sp.]|nr:MAG: hypothetical protein J3Q66DRAFT_375781 [Benniella sp.]
MFMVSFIEPGLWIGINWFEKPSGNNEDTFISTLIKPLCTGAFGILVRATFRWNNLAVPSHEDFRRSRAMVRDQLVREIQRQQRGYIHQYTHQAAVHRSLWDLGESDFQMDERSPPLWDDLGTRLSLPAVPLNRNNLAVPSHEDFRRSRAMVRDQLVREIQRQQRGYIHQYTHQAAVHRSLWDLGEGDFQMRLGHWWDPYLEACVGKQRITWSPLDHFVFPPTLRVRASFGAGSDNFEEDVTGSIY